MYVLLVHQFVYFARVHFCPFSLPLDVKSWLRLVIVALPGLYYCQRYNRLKFLCLRSATKPVEPRHEKHCLYHIRTAKAPIGQSDERVCFSLPG